MRWYQPASYHYGFRQLASEESCNKEVWSWWEGELKHIADHLTHRWITAKKPKSACHFWKLTHRRRQRQDKKSFHTQDKNCALLIHFLLSIVWGVLKSTWTPGDGVAFLFSNLVAFLTYWWVYAIGEKNWKRTAKSLCVTNVTGLFLARFVWSSLKLMFSGLLQKDLVKEGEV